MSKMSLGGLVELCVKEKFFLDHLVAKRDCVKLFDKLRESDFDLAQRGGILLFKSALSGKLKNVEALLDENYNDFGMVVYLTVTNLMNCDLAKDKRLPILELLIPKLSKEQVFIKLEESNYHKKEDIQFIQKLWLENNLKSTIINKRLMKV